MSHDLLDAVSQDPVFIIFLCILDLPQSHAAGRQGQQYLELHIRLLSVTLPLLLSLWSASSSIVISTDLAIIISFCLFRFHDNRGSITSAP